MAKYKLNNNLYTVNNKSYTIFYYFAVFRDALEIGSSSISLIPEKKRKLGCENVSLVDL